jgi:hypothetical protein
VSANGGMKLAVGAPGTTATLELRVYALTYRRVDAAKQQALIGVGGDGSGVRWS